MSKAPDRTSAGPLPRHDHTGTCWWCGAAAPGTTFCADCNGARSASSDDAFHAFVAWCLANERSLDATGAVVLEDVYEDWQAGRRQLLRYFAQHVGCRIADAGYAVPKTIPRSLDGTPAPKGLALAFEINALHAELNAAGRAAARPGQPRAESVMLGPLTGDLTDPDREAVALRGWWAYHGLQLTWEWSMARTDFWTNLDAAAVTLPTVKREEADSMRKVRIATAAMTLAAKARGGRKRRGSQPES